MRKRYSSVGRRPRSTPAGQHRAVLLDEVLACLDPLPGQIVVDCTVGWGGHAVELLRRVGPEGQLIGMDADSENLPRARERLEAVGGQFSLHHGNFAGILSVLPQAGLERVDMILADLGMSSMQVDDPERGFSYARDGTLDMRLDRSRGRSAAQMLAEIKEEDLAQALRELGDEPEAGRIASAIIKARAEAPIQRTRDLARIIMEALGAERWQLHPRRGKWNSHPAARTFQAVRILLNRELANLAQLLRVLPDCLKPGGRAAVISFHSGEDRLVKGSFRKLEAEGVYVKVAEDPVRPSLEEKTVNPRSRSAKMRWAVRSPLS